VAIEDVEAIGASSYVDDLAHLLDELRLERVYLVAQSMGGATCAAFACRYPDRVRRCYTPISLAGSYCLHA